MPVYKGNIPSSVMLHKMVVCIPSLYHFASDARNCTSLEEMCQCDILVVQQCIWLRLYSQQSPVHFCYEGSLPRWAIFRHYHRAKNSRQSTLLLLGKILSGYKTNVPTDCKPLFQHTFTVLLHDLNRLI